jgi:hypothetical protein
MEQVDQQGFEKGRGENPVEAADQQDKYHHSAVEACGDYGQPQLPLDDEIYKPKCAIYRNNQENEETGLFKIKLIVFGIHVPLPMYPDCPVKNYTPVFQEKP